MKHHFLPQHLQKAQAIPLGENITFDTSRMIASQINEQNELSSAKSFFLRCRT